MPSAPEARAARRHPRGFRRGGRAGTGLCALGLAAVLAHATAAQGLHAVPSGEGGGPAELLQAGERALECEDPVRAWSAFRAASAVGGERTPALLGLGRTHLLLGRAATAEAYAECVLARDGGEQDAMTLAVRARIRGRQFDLAVQSAERFLAAAASADAELLAAHASALFRVQRTEDAAEAYRRVLAADREHPEANLRLGSGLSAPRAVRIGPRIRTAVAHLRAGRLESAVELLLELLQRDPGNPVAHRLLGEALFQRRANASMAGNDACYAALRRHLPLPDVAHLPAAEFVPGYRQLGGERRAVVDRALALFGSRLGKLLSIGARHDLLLETDRTTDAESRSKLRGRPTFDGRVWDDVRGIGGLHAATGIEALDEAAQFGFDTLVHELAHQVHYYALLRRDRVRISQLYAAAMAEGRCLDYYAASNEAEYFGQGVEAFASLAKRPGGETTHGHTRFELLRVDPALHAFVARIVDNDPLAGPEREALLVAAYDVALRCGRPEDAVTAAGLLPPGEEREARLRRAQEVARDASSH